MSLIQTMIILNIIIIIHNQYCLHFSLQLYTIMSPKRIPNAFSFHLRQFFLITIGPLNARLTAHVILFSVLCMSFCHVLLICFGFAPISASVMDTGWLHVFTCSVFCLACLYSIYPVVSAPPHKVLSCFCVIKRNQLTVPRSICIKWQVTIDSLLWYLWKPTFNFDNDSWINSWNWVYTLVSYTCLHLLVLDLHPDFYKAALWPFLLLKALNK